MIAKSIETQNLQKEHQMEAMLQYLNNENECRSKLLLTYFGQTENSDCGICSTCIQKKQTLPSTIQTIITEDIIRHLKNSKYKQTN